MLKQKRKKVFALLISICLIFQMIGTNAFATPLVPATTYYVGGENASDSNDGISSETPLATVAAAANIINALEAGSYTIYVQGGTIEQNEIMIGDSTKAMQVAIVGTATGSAITYAATGSSIIMRGDSNIGHMITVKSKSTLTLGDASGTGEGKLFLDGGSFSDGSTVGSIINVNNEGTLKLYGATTLRNNKQNRDSYTIGGAIYNYGTLHIYNGTIENNTADYGGGIYNDGSIVMENATISNNEADYAGGIYNESNCTLNGGNIDNNKSRYNGGGVYNESIFVMNDGTISNNTSEGTAGGLRNSGTFTLNGGTISNNQAVGNGGGIMNYDVLKINGGSIESNTALYGGAVYNNGQVFLSGMISIPGGVEKKNDFYTKYSLGVLDSLASKDNNKIVLSSGNFAVGSTILSGASLFVKAAYQMFEYKDSRFILDDAGKLQFGAAKTTYYVGGADANDTNSGITSTAPFATLAQAITTNRGGNCDIILQSNITLEDTLPVTGDVTIMSDGMERTISLGSSFTGSRMFYVVSGTLNLGKTDNTDTTENLVLDLTTLYNSFYDGITVESGATLNVYSGVAIKNSTSNSTTIYNNGTTKLLGGSLRDNKSSSTLYNYGTATIAGVTFSNNTGSQVVRNYANLQMTSGTITGNTGAGIDNRSIFTMSGGTINTASTPGVINEGKLNLSGAAVISCENNTIMEIGLAGSTSSINLTGALTGGTTFIIDLQSYYSGRIVLTGDSAVVSSNASKFELLSDKDTYTIGQDGTLTLKDTTRNTYYVGGAGANDTTMDGLSQDKPLATLTAAITKIGNAAGVIVLQGDITLDVGVTISSDITLMSDGNVRTISRGTSNTNTSLFAVVGKLTLGNPNNSGSDTAPTLIIDGNGENVSASYALIDNQGVLNLYSGVSLQNNDLDNEEASGVNNRGVFHMFGGMIQDNVGGMTGGVQCDNLSTFIMEKGKIINNESEIGGITLSKGSNFIMNGGSIENNKGGMSYEGTGGVLFYESSTFTMNAGKISGNSGRVGGVLVRGDMGIMKAAKGTSYTVPCVFDMNGGTISGNTGTIPGVLVYGNVNKIMMSGNATISEGDCVSYLYGSNNSGVVVEGPLSTTAPITVAIYEMVNLVNDKSIKTQSYEIKSFMVEETVVEQRYPIGTQLLSNSAGYSFTAQDLAKFTLTDSNYSISKEGYLAKLIKDSWIAITGNTNLYSTGSPRTVTIAVTDGSKTLLDNVDYSVSYTNNISAGTATVTITGKGAYSGTLSKNFTIKAQDGASTPSTVVPTTTPAPKGTLIIPIDLTGTKLPQNKENLTIPVPKENLLGQIKQEGVTDVRVAVSIPNSALKSGNKTDLILEKEVMEAAKQADKSLAVSVTDTEGRERYRWEFDETELSTTQNEMSDVNLFLEVGKITDQNQITENLGADNTNGLVISFGHDGVLPTQAKVRIYVGDQEGVVAGEKVFLYHFNPATGKLETLPYSKGYVVDADGYVSFEIVHCSDYVILPKAADNKLVTSLRDQITAEVSASTIYTDETAKIMIALPSTLELLTSSVDQTSQTAIGGVTAIYRSSNKKIATVDKEGVITAVKAGKVTIITIITLYSGKTKIVRSDVTVKDSKITLKASTDTLKVGETFTFKAEVAGLKEADIVWSTTKKSIILIDKKTGKATAKAAGVDYVVATVGDEVRKIKVVVE